MGHSDELRRMELRAELATAQIREHDAKTRTKTVELERDAALVRVETLEEAATNAMHSLRMDLVDGSSPELNEAPLPGQSVEQYRIGVEHGVLWLRTWGIDFGVSLNQMPMYYAWRELGRLAAEHLQEEYEQSQAAAESKDGGA